MQHGFCMNIYIYMYLSTVTAIQALVKKVQNAFMDRESAQLTILDKSILNFLTILLCYYLLLLTLARIHFCEPRGLSVEKYLKYKNQALLLT